MRGFYQSDLHALFDHPVKNGIEGIHLDPFFGAQLDNRGPVGNPIRKRESQKPAIRGVHGDFLFKFMVAQIIEIADKYVPENQLRIPGRPPGRIGIQMVHDVVNEAEVHIPVNQPEQMVLGYQPLDFHKGEQLLLSVLPRSHQNPPYLHCYQ